MYSLAPVKSMLDFTGARDDWVAVASAGPYANHLHLARSRSRQITTPKPHHSVFTGQMAFLSPNQRRQSTDGK